MVISDEHKKKYPFLKNMTSDDLLQLIGFLMMGFLEMTSDTFKEESKMAIFLEDVKLMFGQKNN